MTKPLKSTLRRLERAAMRMVDRNGWLIEPTSSGYGVRRRNEFEDAVNNHRAAHAAAKGKRGKGK